MTAPEIDWSSAKVNDGELVVKLSCTPPKEWRERAVSVAEMLGGRWGEVAVKKDAIQVADVSEGSESDVRHFLESIVLEANAVLPEEKRDDDEDDAEEEEDAGGEDADSPDRRMTEAFRAFGS